jgi:uncharacterized protein YidB (DUF937 family)
VRQVYVEAAVDELKSRGQKQTITNISTLTGLNRKESKRLLATEIREVVPDF